MSFKPENIIKLSSSWIDELKDIPIRKKNTWNKFLKIIFEDDLPKQQILLLSLQKVSKPNLTNYTKEEISKSLALLVNLKNNCDASNDPKSARALENKITEIVNQVEVKEIVLNNYVNQYQELLSAHEKSPTIKFQSSIILLIADHLLRWVVLWVFISEGVGSVMRANILFIPLLMIPLFYLRQRVISRKNNNLIKQYLPQKKIKKVKVFTASQWTIIAFIFILSIIVSYTLASEDYISAIITSIGFFFYYGAYTLLWSEKELSEEQLIYQIQEDYYNTEALTPQKNDEVIVEQTVTLKSITGKLEAYVLESALFGALAFSGFLQIMAENLITFEDLSNFGGHLFMLFKSLVYMDGAALSSTLTLLSSKKDLFSLISLETLLCSAFFLVVIASRLRFTDKADKVEESLEMARAINEKEELLLQKEDESNKEKLNEYNLKIATHLIKGNKDLEEIKPVLSYMRYFRNADIFTFFIVLISSALFISSFISWLITIIAITSYGFFNRKELKDRISHLLYVLRIIFIRKGYYFLFAAVVIYSSGFLLRVQAQWQNTDPFILAGCILLGIYLFTWIVFIPHYDKKFLFQKDEVLNSNWWLAIRGVWGLTLLTGMVAYAFKLLHQPLANELMMMSMTLFIIITNIIGIYLVRPRWLGIITSVSLSWVILGIMFKFLRIRGANEALLIGLTLIILLLLIINLWKIKNKFLALFKSVGPILLIAGVLFKILYLSGANNLIILGGILSLIALILYYRFPNEKRIFHKVYIINALVVVVISMTTILDRRSPTGELAYSNYTTDGKILYETNIIRRERNDLFMKYIAGMDEIDSFDIFFPAHLKKVEQYRSFSKDLPLTIDEEDMMKHYYAIGLRIYDDKNASVRDLQVGYQLAQKANMLSEKREIPKSLLINNNELNIVKPIYLPTLEVLFLKRLGKIEEAKVAAENIIKQKEKIIPEIKEEISNLLKED